MGASEASSLEQANECEVQANGRGSGPVLQSLFSAVIVHSALSHPLQLSALFKFQSSFSQLAFLRPPPSTHSFCLAMRIVSRRRRWISVLHVVRVNARVHDAIVSSATLRQRGVWTYHLGISVVGSLSTALRQKQTMFHLLGPTGLWMVCTIR